MLQLSEIKNEANVNSVTTNSQWPLKNPDNGPSLEQSELQPVPLLRTTCTWHVIKGHTNHTITHLDLIHVLTYNEEHWQSLFTGNLQHFRFEEEKIQILCIYTSHRYIIIIQHYPKDALWLYPQLRNGPTGCLKQPAILYNSSRHWQQAFHTWNFFFLMLKGSWVAQKSSKNTYYT